MHVCVCMWVLCGSFYSWYYSCATESLPLQQEKGQKRLNQAVPHRCSAAARFLGNREVWLAARPCNVESCCIEANLNRHLFLSRPSHQYSAAQSDTRSHFTHTTGMSTCTDTATGIHVYGIENT